MRHSLYVVFFWCSLFFTSCNDGSPRSVSNEINKINCENKTSVKVDLNPQWGIDELTGIKDGSLVCKSSQGEYFYYVFNIKDFSLEKSFGVRGNGKDEWGAPCLLLSQERGISYVLDNAKDKMTILKDYSISEVTASPFNGVANQPKLFGKYLCFADEKPNKIVFRLNEFKTNKNLAFVEFEDKQNKGNSYLDAFVYDINDEFVVLAQNLKDCFEVYRLSPDSRLRQVCEVKGDGLTDEDKYIYYSSVVINGDNVYLLSQRHVDISNQSGYSSIEVYGLDGKALRNIRLDFIASHMVMNAADHTLYLLSALEGSLHVVKL